MRRYSTFEQIDADLRMLKLQTDIDKEEFKISLYQAKKSLSPLNLIGNIIGSIAQKAFVLKAVDALFGLPTVREKDVKH